MATLQGHIRNDAFLKEESRKKAEIWVKVLLSILVLGYGGSDCWRIYQVDKMFHLKVCPSWLRPSLIAGQVLVIVLFLRASVVLVLQSEPQDIVLNGVALTFALELDNFFVKRMHDELEYKPGKGKVAFARAESTVLDDPEDRQMVQPLLGGMSSG